MKPDATVADVAAVLAHVTAGLPGHEDRPGQLHMAELVAEAIRSKTHLMVQVGTGTTLYDPDGNLLSGIIPDSQDGAFDNGWLGGHRTWGASVVECLCSGSRCACCTRWTAQA